MKANLKLNFNKIVSKLSTLSSFLWKTFDFCPNFSSVWGFFRSRQDLQEALFQSCCTFLFFKLWCDDRGLHIVSLCIASLCIVSVCILYSVVCIMLIQIFHGHHQLKFPWPIPQPTRKSSWCLWSSYGD